MFGTTALRIRPVPSENVSFQGGFWEPRLDRNRRQTLEAQYQQNIRSGAIDALRVWDGKGRSRPGHPYKTSRIGPSHKDVKPTP